MMPSEIYLNTPLSDQAQPFSLDFLPTLRLRLRNTEHTKLPIFSEIFLDLSIQWNIRARNINSWPPSLNCGLRE